MGKVISPGAALLRSSRFFSLPKPLPPPPSSSSGMSRLLNPSATPHYPTHQAIITPRASRWRGDWGLKRPMPLKTTTKGTLPMLRIHQVDTVEHITDFNSSTDVALSLRKWQQMNIPIVFPSVPQNGENMTSKVQKPSDTSVFEEDCDFTAPVPGKDKTAEEFRWQFKGPWLAGMSNGDFNQWLAKGVRPRREEFMHFLRGIIRQERAAKRADEELRWLNEELNKKAEEQLRKFDENGFGEELEPEGEQAVGEQTVGAQTDGKKTKAEMTQEERDKAREAEMDEAEAKKAEAEKVKAEKDAAMKVTDEELVEFLRELRVDRPRLYRLVGQFLDLAPVQPPTVSDTAIWLGSFGRAITMEATRSPYALTGPPSTHPSAGLSYLRSSAYVDMHPIYGPQQHHPSVEARVIYPRPSAKGRSPAKLGVGGFLTESPSGDTSSNRVYNTRKTVQSTDPINFLDIRKWGGGKYWVTPKAATIDSRGRVNLVVGEPEKRELVVTQEQLGITEVFGRASEIGDRKQAEWEAFNKTVETYADGSGSAYGLDGRDSGLDSNLDSGLSSPKPLTYNSYSRY